jgi:hypothetical protein
MKTTARWRPALAAIAGLAVLVAAGASASTAEARGWMGRTGYAYNGHTLGTLKPTGYSVQAVCINSADDLPSRMTSPKKVRQPQAAYLLTKYGQTTDDDLAAAMAYVVKDLMNDPDFGIAKDILKSLPSSTETRVRNLIADLRAEAAQFAGPYSMLKPAVALTDPTDPTAGGTVSNIGIQAASGSLISGVSITLRLSGPAMFTSSGSNTLTITSSASPQTEAFSISGVGDIDAAATSAKSLASEYVDVHPSPSGTNDQRMVTAPAKVSVYAEDPAGPSVLFKVDVSSQVAKKVLSPTSALSDAVDRVHFASTDLVEGTIHTTGTLYGPMESAPTEQADVPDGLDVAASIDQDVALRHGEGDATYELGSVPAASGYYTWVESVAADDSINLEASSGTFGRASETFFVLAPATVTTKVSNQQVMVGATISDTATVKGLATNLPDGVDVTMSGSAIRQPAAAGGVCAGLDWAGASTVAAIADVKVTRDGDYEGLGEHVVNDPGCETYGEQLTATYDGDVLWTVEHKPGDVTQTALVLGVPSITTNVSSQQAIQGDVVSDTATISGLATSVAPGMTVTLTGKALGMQAALNSHCDGLDWSGTPVLAEIPATVVTADGVISGLGAVKVTQSGCATWGETLTGTAADGTVVWTVEHKPGFVTQTTVVRHGGGLDVGSGQASMSATSAPVGVAGAGLVMLAAGVGVGTVWRRRAARSRV